MNLYGNRIWNDATDNRVKSIVSMTAADFDTLKDKLDTSGINYYAYSNGNNVRMAVNDKDLNWLEQLAETELSASKSDKPYSPPKKILSATPNTSISPISSISALTAIRL